MPRPEYPCRVISRPGIVSLLGRGATLLASRAEQPDAYSQSGHAEKGMEESLGEALSLRSGTSPDHTRIMANQPQGGKGGSVNEPNGYSRRSASWRALFTA